MKSEFTCECCYKHKSTARIYLGGRSTLSLALCDNCNRYKLEDIWVKMTNHLIDRILEKQEQQEQQTEEKKMFNIDWSIFKS